MKSFDTELKKYTQKVSLSAAERRDLRERVLTYMEYHPLKKQVMTKEKLAEGIPSQSFVTYHLTATYARLAGGALVIALILTSLVAQRAVPGDVLYFVKTGVNETIEGQFANSPYEKIEFETKLMERRIAEARSLAEEGKLTDDVKEQIVENVKEHTQAVQDGLAELRTQDAEGAAIAKIAFSSSLEVQSAVLGAEMGEQAMTLSAESGTEGPSPIESILTAVNEAREEVGNQAEATPSFESLAAQVETETTRAYELFSTIRDSANSQEMHAIERRLSDIDRLIVKAQKKHDEHPEDSTNDLAKTLGLLQKLIVFMSNIDVRETVSLDAIVPVVLSDEERTDIVKEEIRTIGALKSEIEQRLEVLEDTGIKEKAAEGLGSVEDLLFKTSTALDVADIDTAETDIHEARALITDIDMMTQVSAEVAAPEEEVPPTETETTTDELGSTTPEVVPEEPSMD